MAPPSGAAGMGTARGTIELDISQLERAAAHARALGQAFEQALGNVSNGATRAQSTFQQLNSGITSLRGELLALGAGAGILTGLGLAGAQNLRAYTIAFRQFTNSQKEAVELTNRLISLANQYGLEWEGVQQLGRALIPSLKGGAAELDGWISRAARLRSLFPAAPRGSETIAISEFLAGQTTSLARRFNVPMSVIKDATSQFDDLGQAFDYILERRGATEEAALAMANSFTGVRNELQLLLAQGFMPLFEFLRPILAAFREWLGAVRESNPEVATAGAGLIALAAAGAPAILMFNQLVMAAEKLKALGVLSLLGKGGVLAGAALVGGGIGFAGGNAINAARGQQQQTLGDVWETFKKLLFIVGAKLNEFAQMMANAAAYVSNGFHQMIANMLNAVANFTRGLAGMLPGGMGGNTMMQAAAGMDAMAGMSRGAGQRALGQAAQFSQQSNAMLLRAARGLMAGSGGAADVGPGASVGGGGMGDDLAERNKVISDWAKAAAKIEADAANQRLQATQDYERQRSQTIAQYELSIARDAEDFARSRARAAAQLAKQIADVGEEAARREAAQIRDYNEKIAELRSDGNERIQKLEEDYADDREKAERDHRDRLLSAAARLDAVGVFEEQRRFKNQQEDAEKAFGERLTTEQDNLQERLDEEKRGHERRLTEARDADARRIADMRESLAESQALEDEDRAVAAERRAADFQQQLSQMATAQAERMTQISTQAAQEKAALDERFMAELEAAGVHNEQYLAIQKAKQDASLLLFDDWWNEINKKFAPQGPKTEAEAQATAWPQSFADGGWVQRGGTAVVHAGEYVVNAGAARAMAGGMARNVTIGDINVYGAPGMSTDGLAAAVRRELMAALEEAA